MFFSFLGEGGEDKPGSTDQVLEEAATGLESGLDEEEEEDDDVVDLRAFSAIGPLMFIELLDLPPQPKVVNGWIMQQSKCYTWLVNDCRCPNKILISGKRFGIATQKQRP